MRQLKAGQINPVRLLNGTQNMTMKTRTVRPNKNKWPPYIIIAACCNISSFSIIKNGKLNDVTIFLCLYYSRFLWMLLSVSDRCLILIRRFNSDKWYSNVPDVRNVCWDVVLCTRIEVIFWAKHWWLYSWVLLSEIKHIFLFNVKIKRQQI